MLIETHAHLDYPDFANDFDDMQRHAIDANVTRIITIHRIVDRQLPITLCRAD